MKLAQVTVLDVKSSEWNEHYNKFKLGIRDLEVMLQNAIASAFEDISTVDAGVELLDYFSDVCVLLKLAFLRLNYRFSVQVS